MYVFEKRERDGKKRHQTPAAGPPEGRAHSLVPPVPGGDLPGDGAPVPGVPGGEDRQGGWRTGMTLAELAVSYRDQADALRHRIQLVEELPARDAEERLLKAERLRVLEAMRRDVRDVAVICERYYERGYRRNERYTI